MVLFAAAGTPVEVWVRVSIEEEKGMEEEEAVSLFRRMSIAPWTPFTPRTPEAPDSEGERWRMEEDCASEPRERGEGLGREEEIDPRGAGSEDERAVEPRRS